MGHNNSIPGVMDHGHAHPSHDVRPATLGNNDRQQTSYPPLSFLGVPNTSSTLRRSPQSPLEIPLSLPQRRLQLRNAGFRASRLPSDRLSTKKSGWFADKDDSHVQRQRTVARNRENSPPTIRRRNTGGPQTAGSILQIANSNHCSYTAINTSALIHEDAQDDSPSHSWYHDAPTTQLSPSGFNTCQDNGNEMKLREISGNAQRSSPMLSSPLAPQLRGQSKRSLNLRTTSFPVSEHIVFLETKLEEVEKSQYSPNSGLLLKDKIKALSMENSRLQETLAELEHQFEARLRESVEHKTSSEMNLRRKIKQLEDEISSKDGMIRDLEHRNDVSLRDLSHAEAYRAAVERLEAEKEGLEETNRSLEKRNDVLTQLLGQSPTRSHHGFELPSPVRDSSRRTPRAKSMMPRLPSSPTHNATRKPLSMHAFPSSLQHNYCSPLAALNRERDHPCDGAEYSEPEKSCEDVKSIDSGSGDWWSVHSGNAPISKRSSMYSYPSAGAATWGPPLPPSPTDGASERSSRKRTTRRFASGSTQLKPLVLPTLNATSGYAQSGSLPTANPTADRRDISPQSIDPTVSFLSRIHDTPTQPRRRSNTWAAADALKALEGTGDVHFASLEEVLADEKTSQAVLWAAQTSHDAQNQSNLDFGTNQLSPCLIDDVIVEEDSTAFLSNQFEDAGYQSFSSMVGELSINDSDIDGSYIDEHPETAHFVGSELPCRISLEVTTSAVCQLPVEEPKQRSTPQVDCEASPDPTFSPTRATEGEFRNPLASSHLPLNARSQYLGGLCTAENQPMGCSEQEMSSTQSFSMDTATERPNQRYSTSIGLQTVEKMIQNPLKAAPSRHGIDGPRRSKSALDLLQRKGSPTGSLTSLTNRTIFGMVSRYTSYVRDLKRDPTALARRVIVNAWCSNWKQVGTLSWWVLGLFLGPGWKQKVENRQGWEGYDGENIAEAEHEGMSGGEPHLVQDRHARAPSMLATPDQSANAHQQIAECGDEATRVPQRSEVREARKMKCNSCGKRSKISWAKSLYLWGKFSIAIMLAVGGAVIQGPQEMLKDCDGHGDAAAAAASETPTEHIGIKKHHPSDGANHETPTDYAPKFHESDINDGDDIDDDDNRFIAPRTVRPTPCPAPRSTPTSSTLKPINLPLPPSPSPSSSSTISLLPRREDNNSSSCTYHTFHGVPAFSSSHESGNNRALVPVSDMAPLKPTTVATLPRNVPRPRPRLPHPHYQQADVDRFSTEAQLLLPPGEKTGEGEDGSSDLGTLKWVQGLTMRDLEGHGDRDGMVEPSPKRRKKRARRPSFSSFFGPRVQ